MIAGGAGGGALLLAAVAFFMYRRRSKRQSDSELPQFSNSKPQQAAAPVFTPAPLFLTPSVRSRPHTQSALHHASCILHRTVALTTHRTTWQDSTFSLPEDEEAMSPLERQTVDLHSEEALALAASFAALDGDAAKHAGKDAKQAKLSALKAALKGHTTMVKERYTIELGSQEQGASAVVVFAYDSFTKERVALKFMVDEAEFTAESERFMRAACKFVVQVRDVVTPAKDSNESSLEHYAFLVCERGDFTL